MYAEEELAQMLHDFFQRSLWEQQKEGSTWSAFVAPSEEEILELMKKAYILGHEHGFEEALYK